MNAFGTNGMYESISQRVAATYRRLLSAFCPVLPEGLGLDQQAAFSASQAELHAFFTALYDALLTAPAAFGLPVSEDIFLLQDHSKEGPNKTALKKLLDRPRKMIEDGLGFLRAAAASGRIVEQTLVIEPGDPALDLLKKKPLRAWVSGMAGVGVEVIDAGDSTLLTSPRFPHMLPALQALSRACVDSPNPALGAIFFARCDFRALRQDFSVDPLDLYTHTFAPEDSARALELHEYFTARGYQPLVTLQQMHQWDVKYQGKKSVKASPLFQINFDERMLRPLRSQIKIASARRIAPLIGACSQVLQDDFALRLFPCKDCGWCGKKSAAQQSMLYSYNGQERKICWYVNPDIESVTPDTIALVKEYEQVHEALEV